MFLLTFLRVLYPNSSIIFPTWKQHRAQGSAVQGKGFSWDLGEKFIGEK